MDNAITNLDTLGMYFNSLSAASWPEFMYFFMLNKAGIALPDRTYEVETKDGLKIIMRQNKLADMETFLEISSGSPTSAGCRRACATGPSLPSWT